MPKDGKPMKVAVFFSGGASSFKAMLDDPNYGKLYDVVVGVTNKEDPSGKKLFTDNKIPVIYHPLNFKSFDVESAKPMYEEVLETISEFSPDLIAMSGFMRILTYPVIEQGSEKGEYTGRALNVHPADLSILSGRDVKRLYAGQLDWAHAIGLAKKNNLRPKYKGEDAVYDAIISGEDKTRSTVHIATEIFDEGPIVVQSKPFMIDEKVQRWIKNRNFRPVRDYADNLQEKMKVEGDGPAYVKVMEMTASGDLSLTDGQLFYRGNPLTYHGFRLD